MGGTQEKTKLFRFSLKPLARGQGNGGKNQNNLNGDIHQVAGSSKSTKVPVHNVRESDINNISDDAEMFDVTETVPSSSPNW